MGHALWPVIFQLVATPGALSAWLGEPSQGWEVAGGLRVVLKQSSGLGGACWHSKAHGANSRERCLLLCRADLAVGAMPQWACATTLVPIRQLHTLACPPSAHKHVNSFRLKFDPAWVAAVALS